MGLKFAAAGKDLHILPLQFRLDAPPSFLYRLSTASLFQESGDGGHQPHVHAHASMLAPPLRAVWLYSCMRRSCTIGPHPAAAQHQRGSVGQACAVAGSMALFTLYTGVLPALFLSFALVTCVARSCRARSCLWSGKSSAEALRAACGHF